MTAVFTGSFDPPTYGHFDLIERSSRIVDKLIVLVLNNSAKNTLFSVEERLVMLNEQTKRCSNVDVEAFDGLLVDYLKEHNIRTIIRGLRSLSDYEYEFNMSLVNKTVWNETETIFLPSSPQFIHLSSSIAKEIAAYGGNLKDIVPPTVESFLYNKFYK